MIQSGRASLVVVSTNTEPAAISDMLALEPTDVQLKGTATRSGRVRDHHVWSLVVDTVDNTDDDQTGTGALWQLLELSLPAYGRVGNLPDDCDARIWWSADSDSPQGGFVLPVELSEKISTLGIDVYGTVYFDESSETASPDSKMADHDVLRAAGTEPTEDGSVTPADLEDGDEAVHDADIPTSLTLEEAFRAAFFMIGIYGDIESWRSEDLVLLSQYMRSDPARWNDWKRAVRMALNDPQAASENLKD